MAIRRGGVAAAGSRAFRRPKKLDTVPGFPVFRFGYADVPPRSPRLSARDLIA